MDDEISLAAVLQELHDRYGRCPPYVTLWTHAAAHRIPAQRLPNGRWRVRRDAIPQIAAFLRLAA